MSEASFNGVRVRRLDDSGGSQDIYDTTVPVIAQYAPQGMTVRIPVEKEFKEFLVSNSSEFAR